MGEDLEDLSPMPFGMHKGKPMQDVPVRWLHWLWHECSFGRQSPVGRYIRKNATALEKEDDDLIWDWSLE